MQNSKIEWTDHTFNPWEGCTKVSPGCLNCYAENRDQRWHGGIHWGKGAPRRRTSASNWTNPIKWNHKAQQELENFITGVEQGAEMPWTSRPRVFCASLADWLDHEIPIEWLADLLNMIRITPYLDWLLLTKRPENFSARIHDALRFSEGIPAESDWPNRACKSHLGSWLNDWTGGISPANVWIGTTVENQDMAERRIPQILSIPANVRFLSVEPMIGPVHLNRISRQTDHGMVFYDDALTGFRAHNAGGWFVEERIHWVICGGESGVGAREFSSDWARSLRDHCAAAKVAFFMKQMGGTRKPFPEIPDDLMIRQFPESS